MPFNFCYMKQRYSSELAMQEDS